MLIRKTLRLNRFVVVMDELDLGAQFVRQFENRNFRLLGRFIFPGDSFQFNRQLSVKSEKLKLPCPQK